MTAVEDLKQRIIALQNQNNKLKDDNASLRRQSAEDSAKIIKQRDLIAKYQEKLYPHQKYIAVHSTVVFEDKTVAFSTFSETRQQNFIRSDTFHRSYVNLSGSQIVSMANGMPYNTDIAFTKPELKELDGSFADDVLIPIDKALPQQLGDFARTQLTEIINELKSQKVADTERIIGNRNPLSEYSDDTNTLKLGHTQIAVRSVVVFSNKTVAYNVFSESREQTLFYKDSFSRGHVNLSRDLILGLATSHPFRTNISFTGEHLKEFDVTYDTDTLFPIDETLSKNLCEYAIERLGSIIKSQFEELSTYKIED